MESNVPAVERVREWVRVDFGFEAVRLVPFGGGLDPDATVWKAADADGDSWAVKWTTRDNRVGLRMSASLADEGVTGVPRPRSTSGGVPWSDHDGGRLSVTAWIAGLDAYETGLTPAQWAAYGRLLRRIHDHRPPPAEDDGATRTARHGIRRAGVHVRRRLEEIDRLVAAPAPPDDPVHERFAALWPDARRRIVDLRDLARTLRRGRTPTTRVGCHGDPHLGNVVVDPAGRPWLIDFDDAVRAPREVDLVLVELGVLFSRPIGDEQREAFRHGYGPVALDPVRLLRFGAVRAVEDLVETAHELFAGDSTTPDEELLALFTGILSPSGLAGLVEARRDESGHSRAPEPTFRRTPRRATR